MIDLKVDRKLLPMKGHYFLYNAGAAPIVPFMSIYAKQLGFSSFVVGIIYTVLPFSGMLTKPLMGVIADRYKCQKLIFLIAQVLICFSFFAKIFLPSMPVTGKIHFASDKGEAFMDTCGHKKFTFDQNNFTPNEVLCSLTCPLDKRDWDNVQDWHGSDRSSGNLDFVAHVSMNLTDQLKDCIYFHVKQVSVANKTITSFPNLKLLSVTCDVTCNSKGINNIIAKSQIEDSNFYSYYQFWLLLASYLFTWICQAVIVSFGDTICFQLLGSEPFRYGYQRMYGALGWGIFSIIAGFLVDAFSKNNVDKSYTEVFSLGIVVMVFCVLVSYQIKYTQPHISTKILRDVGRVLTNIPVFIFIMWCLCMGLTTALMWNFFFWLLEELAESQGESVMSWIKTIEGLAMGIQCLGGELPFFFLSSWILKRIKHVNAMSLILLVTGIRCILYSLLSNPWHCLPIEFLNGITFGLFYATMASYASIIAPPGTETTTQGLVGAIFEGIGVSLGSFIGGILFEDVGGSMTFRIFGIFMLVMCLVHAFVQYLIKRTTERTKDTWAQYATPQDAIDMIVDDS